MSNVTDTFIPTGTYSIRNVANGNTIALPQNGQLLQAGATAAPATELSDKWVVTLQSNKKHTIRNARTGEYAVCEPGHGAGDNVYPQPFAQEWVIKKVQDKYQIYSRSNIQLFWSYTGNQLGAAVEFSRDSTSNTALWTIRMEANVSAFGVPGRMGDLPTPVEGATRPAEKPVTDNLIDITLPKGWLAIVSGVSRGEAINQIYFQSVNPTGKTVDTFQYFNQWSGLGKPLQIKDSDKQALHVSADGGPLVLAFTLFSTTDTSKKDPLVLSQGSQNASKLSVVYVDKSIDDRSFPDYRIYYITSTDGTSYGTNAVITVHAFKKENDLTNPGRPDPGSVNPGYPPTCDEPRPQTLDEYLRLYDAVFLVDDSGSMAGQRWTEVRASMIEIANEAIQYDVDGIGLIFLNSKLRSNSIKGQDALLATFDKVSANGNTPTGARLDVILGEYISKLDAAVGKPEYGTIKPLDLIVITDGVPTDQPKPVLEKWAAYLDSKKHHPNIVGIQFVQIGNDNGAGAALKDLTQGKVRNMVDTVPYNGPLTPERMTRVLLGAIMPSIRTQQQASLKP
ncbi:hypothetical protein FRC02_003121 [Tulasnella sp. 418]|nr:hypothetical protein FRC02_003121 [Tulasnella sp. 418]